MNVELAWEEFIDENRVFLGKGWDGFDVGKRSEVSLLRIVFRQRRDYSFRRNNQHNLQDIILQGNYVSVMLFLKLN
jgi:hypothetical protein